MPGRRAERLDYPAFGNRTLATLADQIVEFPAQRTKIGDLLVDLRKVGAGNRIDSTA